MSRFYVDGKSERPRGYYKKGGRKELSAHLRGWNRGIHVIASVNSEGFDEFNIYETGGSHGPGVTKLLKTVVDRKSAGPRNPKGQLM